MSTITDLVATIGRCRAIDLAQPYYTGIPHHPSASALSLRPLGTEKHGDYVNPGGGRFSASEAIALGAHVGTHIDALCSFSPATVKLYGGEDVADVQTYASGLERITHGRYDCSQSFGAEVLLDIPKIAGLEGAAERLRRDAETTWMPQRLMSSLAISF